MEMWKLFMQKNGATIGSTNINHWLVWNIYFPFHIWNVILPIDELMFFKMVKTTNQLIMVDSGYYSDIHSGYYSKLGYYYYIIGLTNINQH